MKNIRFLLKLRQLFPRSGYWYFYLIHLLGFYEQNDSSEETVNDY